MRLSAARTAVTAIAVIVIAWFAVGLRDLHNLDQGFATRADNISALKSSLRVPSQFTRRLAELRSAQFLNPDTTADLEIAGAYQLRAGPGDLAHALRIAEGVARDEPQNLNAGITVLNIQHDRHDQPGQAAALAHLGRLDPLDVAAH